MQDKMDRECPEETFELVQSSRITKIQTAMAYKITDKCAACGSCKDECPQGAISEGSPHYKINPDECIECGACQAACPSDAIVSE